jgi:type III secretion protein L
MQPLVEEALAGGQDGTTIVVTALPGLGDHQCRITAPDGRIIADLDVQMAALAQRWELSDVA